MTGERFRHSLAVLLILWVVLLSPCASIAQDAEVSGGGPETRLGGGTVELRSPGDLKWRQVGPLLTLRAGDTVQATEDASAVMLLTGRLGTIKVEAANSPFVVPRSPGEQSKIQKSLTLLGESLKHLWQSVVEHPRAPLATRGDPGAPVIVTPRNSLLLPGPFTIEWRGSDLVRYALTLSGPDGVVLERMHLAGFSFDYPRDGPPLLPGVRYSVRVRSARHVSEE